jgi:ubiquinone/menaquinone biosynthesis C-methylase UbiE
MRAAVNWEHILEQLPDPTQAHILDAGCGTGNYMLKLAPNVNRVTGIDLNDAMLEIAKLKLKDFSNVDFKQGSLNDPLPFESGVFDLVTCNQVIHHLWKGGDFSLWNNLVAEFHRVLKPGGKVVLNISFLDQLESYWFIRFFPEILTRFADRVIPKDLLVKGFES